MKSSLNNRYHFFIFLIFVFLSTNSFAQKIISDHVKYENGILKSDAPTVHFKGKVFDLPAGQRTAFIADINPDFRGLRRYFENLSEK